MGFGSGRGLTLLGMVGTFSRFVDSFSSYVDVTYHTHEPPLNYSFCKIISARGIKAIDLLEILTKSSAFRKSPHPGNKDMISRASHKSYTKIYDSSTISTDH